MVLIDGTYARGLLRGAIRQTRAHEKENNIFVRVAIYDGARATLTWKKMICLRTKLVSELSECREQRRERG